MAINLNRHKMQVQNASICRELRIVVSRHCASGRANDELSADFQLWTEEHECPVSGLLFCLTSTARWSIAFTNTCSPGGRRSRRRGLRCQSGASTVRLE